MVRPETPTDELRAAVERSIDSEVVAWDARRGGFSSAGLWVIETLRGDSYFVKAATTDDTADFLRSEMEIYAGIEAPYLPEIEAWVDNGHRPFVVMEDLSGRHWPPPWERSEVEAVLDVCDEIAATPVPPSLHRKIDSALQDKYWPKLAADIGNVVGSEIAPPEWLERALPLLVEVEASAKLYGTSLVHADIRSDNLCIQAGEVKVVDWNWAHIGNPELDVVAWLPSLRLEGGPPPWEVARGDPGLVALVAGFFLYHSTLAPNPMVRSDLRSFQRAQGVIALEWVARLLDLGPPVIAP